MYMIRSVGSRGELCRALQKLNTVLDAHKSRYIVDSPRIKVGHVFAYGTSQRRKHVGARSRLFRARARARAPLFKLFSLASALFSKVVSDRPTRRFSSSTSL